MRFLLAPLFIIGSLLCVAQTTSPTTQPSTQPTIKNPDIEAVVAKMPAKLMPVPDEKKDQIVERIKQIRVWSASNVDGKTFTIKVCHSEGRESYFYVDGYENLKVRVVIISPKDLIDALPKGQEVTIKGTAPKGGFLSVMDPHEKGTKLISMGLVNCELVK